MIDKRILTNGRQFPAASPQNLAAFLRTESARSCRDDEAENRAATKAYQEEKQRKWREETHAVAVAADLEQLAALRKYLIFGKKLPRRI
jgi:hypothetical protein